MIARMDATPPNIRLEQFKETLRRLCIEVENLAIENAVYFDTILASGIIPYEILKEMVAKGLLDEERRKVAHETYSEMWKAVEDSGTGAALEDLLNSLPPTDKPN
jgi:hypothetical protein